MRWLSLSALLLASCAPTFDDAPCYGPDECPTGSVCVERHCLAVDQGAELDAFIEPVDGVEISAPVVLRAAFRPYNLALGPNAAWVVGKTGDNNSARSTLWRVPQDGRPEHLQIPMPPGALGLALRAVTPEPDGGVLLSGSRVDNGVPHILVGRLSPAHTLDPSFGLGGWAHIEVLQRLQSSSEALFVSRLGSGRVIVGLQTHVALPGGLNWAAGVLWLSSGGQLDANLAERGLWTDAELQLAGPAQTFTLDAQGRLWLTGNCGNTSRSCLSRLTTDGVTDQTYGVRGVSRVEHADVGVLTFRETALAMQAEYTATWSSISTAIGAGTLLTLQELDGVVRSRHLSLLPEASIVRSAITAHCGGWLTATWTRESSEKTQVQLRRFTLDGAPDQRFIPTAIPMGPASGHTVIHIQADGTGLAVVGSERMPVEIQRWQARCTAP